MCWSFEASLIIGTISYSIATYLWVRNVKNDRWHAILLFTVSTIQFLEAVIWRMNKDGTDTSNVTKIVIVALIPLVLASEPMSSLYGAHYAGNKISTFDKILYLGIFMAILSVLVINNSYPNVIYDNTIHYQQGELGSSSYYWIFYFLLIYPFIKYGNPNSFYILTGVIVAIALVIALSKKSPGSSWCLYGNVIAILFLFYPYITKLNMQDGI
jgi:hypothetical protein